MRGFLGEKVKHHWQHWQVLWDRLRGHTSKTTRQRGQQAEAAALAHLRRAGLTLLERNYRTPGRGGGEIDLIMREADGTLVFVEVRSRATAGFGGAAGSVDYRKQQRLRYAAQHFLLRGYGASVCRFDVVALEAGQVQWLRAAFEVKEY